MRRRGAPCRITPIIAGLAILVACLGLLGLSALVAKKRVKEIGMGKVAGASIVGVVGLLCEEFAWLVLVANDVAWPVAYYLMRNWLNGFVYRVELSP